MPQLRTPGHRTPVRVGPGTTLLRGATVTFRLAPGWRMAKWCVEALNLWQSRFRWGDQLMTNYACTACPFQAEGLEDLQRHSQETGHVGICKSEAASTGGKLSKLTKRLVVAQGVTLTALGASIWACTYLYAKWQVAEAEIAYLKSPSGAGRNLKNQDKGRDKE
ncbi:hypothetical protein GCM10020367_70460 [Streptomyces sannanensis]|uniref:C2H2-type domain-containing protein n=2 Tax=Streptomyces sannanensis TaxID=285536 RepID=A0ABP6SNI0_9ACTN